MTKETLAPDYPVVDAEWLLRLRLSDVALLDAVLHSRGYSDSQIAQIVSGIELDSTAAEVQEVMRCVSA